MDYLNALHLQICMVIFLVLQIGVSYLTFSAIFFVNWTFAFFIL